MHHYGVRDVEKLLDLPRSTIRALISAGFVTPARGPRNAWQFSFQDLIVLRTAQALASANLSHRRITKSLKELRKHLPASMPLSGLRIDALADRVVVREGGQHWQAENGQYLLAFEGNPREGSLSVIERVDDSASAPATAANENSAARAEVTAANAPLFETADLVAKIARARPAPKSATPDRGARNDAEWFDRAVSLEHDDIDAAVHAYERAIAADPRHLDAYVNFGRLLHEAGRLAQAERVYRAAIHNCGNDATVLFNLGVLFEDMGRKADAVVAYDAAVRADPALADGHYNLALLYEELQKPKDAIRHMAQYRRLVGK